MALRSEEIATMGLKLSTIVKEEGWTAKEQLEAVHAAGVEEWATPGRGPRH